MSVSVHKISEMSRQTYFGGSTNNRLNSAVVVGGTQVCVPLSQTLVSIIWTTFIIVVGLVTYVVKKLTLKPFVTFLCNAMWQCSRIV